MSERSQPISEKASPAIGTVERFRNAWRSHRANLSRHSDLPVLFRTLKRATARLKLPLVGHATFEQLFSAGYDVRTFDDGAMPLEPEKIVRGVLPERWKNPQSVITPKIATLKDAVLFASGMALLPDGRYCHSDTSFTGERRLKTSHNFHARSGKFFYADPETVSTLTRNRMRCVDIPGRCFSTLAGIPRNFGHFVHDVLSRIYYEDLGAIVPGRDRVIAPLLPMAMQKALFREVFEGYEIVEAHPGVALRIEELLLPANLSSHGRFNPSSLAALAKRVRRIMEHHAGKEKKKVCVSRNDSPTKTSHKRTFDNVDAYESRMRKLGYLILNVSELGPKEQFMLWPNATDIVGIHGSGMMNMIMMPSGGNYTEITGTDKRGRSCPNWTARCAMAAGHRVGCLVCARDAQDRQSIDLDRLVALLLGAT